MPRLSARAVHPAPAAGETTHGPANARRPLPRGYFAIGAERISKALNLGNLMRSAHGFGASFTFTIGATYQALEARADTSKGSQHLPHYNWAERRRAGAAARAAGWSGSSCWTRRSTCRASATRCAPPTCWAPSRARCRPELLARCDHVVRIPSSFCINLAMAGAIVMYDRVRCLGRFPPRPLSEGGPAGLPMPGRKLGRGQR